jgi:3-deoxy-D-manno-octulosonic-acid transferase
MILRIISFLGLGFFRFLSYFHPKVQEGFLGRKDLLTRVKIATFSERPLWFHFASSGEFEQCLGILDSLALKNGPPVLLTFFSPSAKRAIELEIKRRQKTGISIPWTYADYGPIDLPSDVEGFLDAVKPLALVFVHRELWPNLIQGCQKKKIPLFLIAARFPKKSIYTFLINYLLKSFTAISTVDEETEKNLKKKISCPIESLGDPRFDRVLERKSRGDKNTQPGPPIFLMASLWKEDFENLKPALLWLFKAKPDWVPVFVPHEIKRDFIQNITQWCNQNGKPHAVVVDKIGVLAELYSTATLAFIGGSFKKKTHNVLEPAVYGVPILSGPYIQNSHEALEMECLGGMLFKSEDATQLKTNLELLTGDKTLRETAKSKCHDYFESRKGASERHVKFLLKYL